MYAKQHKISYSFSKTPKTFKKSIIPVSKPSQISKPKQQELEDNQSKFIAALKTLLKKTEKKLSVNPVTVRNKVSE